VSKNEELGKELIFAWKEARDIKGTLTKLNQESSAEPKPTEAWAELWLNKVRDLRAAFKRFRE